MKSAIKNKNQELKKLTPHDLAFGIGRVATEEELELLMEETKEEVFYSIEDVKTYIEANLKKQQQANKKDATTKI
ncbi:MAG: hypothetical protein H6553_13395 [Chitinophagales bacterium]|nr:hypothetical protein [Chitinophagales bacterium]